MQFEYFIRALRLSAGHYCQPRRRNALWRVQARTRSLRVWVSVCSGFVCACVCACVCFRMQFRIRRVRSLHVRQTQRCRWMDLQQWTNARRPSDRWASEPMRKWGYWTHLCHSRANLVWRNNGRKDVAHGGYIWYTHIRICSFFQRNERNWEPIRQLS